MLLKVPSETLFRTKLLKFEGFIPTINFFRSSIWISFTFVITCSTSISFEKMSISETLPIIKSCDLYVGNDTGWLHLASALDLKCIGLFMDSPALSYGRYSKNINIITPRGFTEETTTHDTLGKDKIDLESVYIKTIQILSN